MTAANTNRFLAALALVFYASASPAAVKCASLLQAQSQQVPQKEIQTAQVSTSEASWPHLNSTWSDIEETIESGERSLWNLSLFLCIGAGLSFFHSAASRADALTGLRAYYALNVFFFHTGFALYSDVGAFFVLSGFVMSISLRVEAGKLETRFCGISDICSFFASRLVRIILPAWLAASMRDASEQFQDKPVTGDAPILFLRVTMAYLITSPTGFIDFWFVKCLCELMVLYPLMEYIMVKADAMAGRRGLLAIALSCNLAKVIMLMQALPTCSDMRYSWAWYFSTTFRVPEFAFGMCLPHLCQNPSGNGAWTGRIADMAAVAVVSLMMLPRQTQVGCMLSGNVQLPLHGALIWGLRFENGNSIAGKLLRCSSVNMLGRLSYTVYLMQCTEDQLGVGIYNMGRQDIYSNLMQLDFRFCLRETIGFLFLVPVAWAISEISEVWPPKLFSMAIHRSMQGDRIS